MRSVDELIERWENGLRVLTSMTRHERQQHFDMTNWGSKTDCGTVACAAGHMSLDPWFRRRGFAAVFTEDIFGYQQLSPTQGRHWPRMIDDFFVGRVNYGNLKEGSLEYRTMIVAEWMTSIFSVDQGSTFREVTTAIRVGIRRLKKLKEEFDARSTDTRSPP